LAGISGGMPLAFCTGMKHRLLHRSVFALIFSILSAPMLGANTPVSVDVENGAGGTYVVDAAFDVNLPGSLAWEVLTDYEGIGRFALSIRHNAKSAIRGSVNQLLDEVGAEMLKRGAR
jgi:hypothetical protein